MGRRMFFYGYPARWAGLSDYAGLALNTYASGAGCLEIEQGLLDSLKVDRPLRRAIARADYDVTNSFELSA